MGVGVGARYLGNKKVELTHLPSGAVIRTDAPKDNNGEGTLFSPTDLVAAALCTCTLTVISIVAERDGVELQGAHAHAEKTMSGPQDGPRRIVALPLVIHLPKALGAELRAKYERVARTCPVHHSLHPDISAPITFVYDV